MAEVEDVRATVRTFIVANYLFGDTSNLPDDEASLMDSGLVDSTGILELIEFLESTFHIDVLDQETLPENLGTIASLTRFVVEKLAVQEAEDLPA